MPGLSSQGTRKLGAPQPGSVRSRGEGTCGAARAGARSQPGLGGSAASLGAEAPRRHRERGVRPARGTHLLVLVGTHRAGRGTPPGRASATTRKREQWPRARGVPVSTLVCGRHTPGAADESHARPRPSRSAKPPAGGVWAGSPRPRRVGRRGRRGDAAGRCRRGSASSSFLLLLLAPSLPTPISDPRRRRASSYVLWSGDKFRDGGWCRALSLRCRKCFLCRRGRVPGSLAGGRRLRGGGGGDGPWRSAGHPACFPSSSPGLRRPATAAAGPGRAAWVSPAPETREGRRDRRDNAGLGRPGVFLWRLRGQSWHFSSSP